MVYESEERPSLGLTRVAEVFPGKWSDFASAGSSLNESFFYEIRFIHLLYGSGILAEGGGYCSEPNGSAFEFSDDCGEYLVVDFVQPEAVDVQGLEAVAGYRSEEHTGRELCVYRESVLCGHQT